MDGMTIATVNASTFWPMVGGVGMALLLLGAYEVAKRVRVARQRQREIRKRLHAR